MMHVYRIANCKYIDDLSGKGAAMYGGRWNSKDTYMVYTAQSAALALLETVVHIGKLPENGFCIISLSVPDNDLQTISIEDLPAGWTQYPPPDKLKAIGDKFIWEGKKPALKVPSVIVPEEFNILLNPAHADFKKVKITGQRSISIDERLLSSVLK